MDCWCAVCEAGSDVDGDNEECGVVEVEGRGCREERISSWNCTQRRAENTTAVPNR